MSTTRRTPPTVPAARAHTPASGPGPTVVLAHGAFAGDVPRATAELMWAGRRPADTGPLGEPAALIERAARHQV
ncbi:hypothetical protein ACIRQQ_02710 [Streptomyces fuscichromogenes]|uniref:hypothetical protein n=1 Tax=Streptomyces fuscichromogenes TaxID=1324013 RepID=UPI003812A4D1